MSFNGAGKPATWCTKKTRPTEGVISTAVIGGGQSVSSLRGIPAFDNGSPHENSWVDHSNWYDGPSGNWEEPSLLLQGYPGGAPPRLPDPSYPPRKIAVFDFDRTLTTRHVGIFDLHQKKRCVAFLLSDC